MTMRSDCAQPGEPCNLNYASSLTTHRCLVWVVNPAARAQQELNEAVAGRLWTEAVDAYLSSEAESTQKVVVVGGRGLHQHVHKFHSFLSHSLVRHIQEHLL